MNPTLLHHSPSFDLPLSSLGHDRSYSNSNSFSTNDYSHSHRRTPNSLTNPGLGATLTNSNLDYSTQPSLTDGNGPYHHHGILLSPPESLSGSIAANGNSAGSPFTHGVLPKPYPIHVSASDVYSGPSAALSSNWTDPMMTSLDRSRLSTIPPPLTPPVTYATSGGGLLGTNHFFPRPQIDRPFSSFPPSNGMSSRYTTMRPLSNSFSYGNGNYATFTHHDHHYPHSMPNRQLEPPKPEGPPFDKTVVSHSVFTHVNQELKPEISASIQKGFFQVDRKWTCYRRNYFTVACSFTLKPSTVDSRYYLSIDGRARTVESFAIGISAKTAAANNQESEGRGLVQHTPKRDKATERVPDKHYVSPAPPHSLHGTGHMSSLIGLMPNGQSGMPMHAYGNYDSQGQQSPPTSYTFERIQFQKATANNGKRRAQQQYFHIVVELSAYISNPSDGEHWVVVATKESEPMVVRGRSPGHYKDNNHRRDSQTSMDRDHGPSGGSDGSGSYSYLGHHPQSNMDWSSRSGNHYHGTGGTYRSCAVTERSPVSAGSSTTLTESPSETDFTMSETEPLKSPSFLFERSTLTTEPEGSEEALFSLTRSPFSRKRRLEEDSADEESTYRYTPPFGDYSGSTSLELSGMTQSKVLCASS